MAYVWAKQWVNGVVMCVPSKLRFTQCLWFCTLPLLLASCSPKTVDYVLMDKVVVIDAKGLELAMGTPLSRQKRSASIWLDVDGSWEVASPWKALLFPDGHKVTLVVEALASDGQAFRASVIGAVYGADGPKVNARFVPEIPKDIAIHKLRISASSNIRCNRIIWHEYNPH